MKHLLVLLFVYSMSFGAVACSKSHGNGDPDGGDTDSDTDTDTDTGDEWCPKLETSCEAPEELEICDVVKLGAPRLIFPLSGRHIRDRRPRIIWEEAPGATQYRLEIARDRAFTDVVYRSTDYQPLGTDRFEHIVQCDLDCGVHFFRVKSVTSPECDAGASSYTWEMFVGMAPGDLDRDGVPDIAYCVLVEPVEEFDPKLVQCFAFFDLDEKGGQTVEPELVVEMEVDEDIDSVGGVYLGDVNGDAFADIGIMMTTDWISSPEESLVEFWIFSGFLAGQVKSDEDAIATIYSPIGVYAEPFLNTRHTDFNGDGYADIAFREYVLDTGDDDPELKLRIVFGGLQGEIEEELVSADVTVFAPEPTPDPWDSSPNIALGALMVDANGDGFADIVSDITGYDSGLAGASVDHVVVVFGSASPPSEVGLFEDTAVISQSSGLYLDDWAIGGNFGSTYAVVWALGDIDFDGYPELGSTVNATDTTVIPDPVETGGYVIFDVVLGPGIRLAEDCMDTVIVGDFEVFDEDTTENLGVAYPCGDLNGDGVDDLILNSSQNAGAYPNYMGRWFYFWGTENWDDLVPVSTSDQIFADDEEYYLVHWVADIDGDEIPETVTATASTECLWLIRFSGSGDQVCLVCEDYGCSWPSFPDIY